MESHPLWSTSPEVCRAYSEDASGWIGVPDGVARPSTESEVVETIRLCLDRGIPVTAQGLRSSTVGGPLAIGGLALSLERLSRLIEIDRDARTAVVEPGMNLGDLKKAIAEAGLFYPPDPTSENECTVGGSVAANASGARTYRYGPTRPYVRELRVVLGDGSVHTLSRRAASKNTVGYFGFQDPIDLLIGSEGTLGIITRVTLGLLPAPAGHFAAMAFFPSLSGALAFALAADAARRSGSLSPRCLELFDAGSLDLIRPEAGRLGIPEGAAAAIYFEEECDPGRETEAFEAWYALLERSGAMADETIVAANEGAKQDLRKMRHAIPSTMNERGQRAREAGGRKLSTDWSVPIAAMPAAVEDASRIVEEVFGGFYIRYGHIGDGHPHFNLLAEDAASLDRAREATHRMALLAVERGGVVASEHGVGKVKREYLRYQYPSWVLDAMRAVKRTLDPAGILAPGNLFD